MVLSGGVVSQHDAGVCGCIHFAVSDRPKIFLLANCRHQWKAIGRKDLLLGYLNFLSVRLDAAKNIRRLWPLALLFSHHNDNGWIRRCLSHQCTLLFRGLLSRAHALTKNFVPQWYAMTITVSQQLLSVLYSVVIFSQGMNRILASPPVPTPPIQDDEQVQELLGDDARAFREVEMTCRHS